MSDADYAFSDTPPNDSGERSYPPYPSFLRFPFSPLNESNRDEFIRRRLNADSARLSVTLTPLEREGLSYYYARLFAAEASSATVGTIAGLAVGSLFAWRVTGPGFISRQLPVSVKTQTMTRRGFRLGAIYWSIKLYAITSGGMTGFVHMQRDMESDPRMQRVVQAQRRWLEQQKGVSLPARMRKTADRTHGSGVGAREGEGEGEAQEQQQQQQQQQVAAPRRIYRAVQRKRDEPEEDDQSLGGLDFYDTPVDPPSSSSSPSDYHSSSSSASSDSATSSTSPWDRLQQRRPDPSSSPYSTPDSTPDSSSSEAGGSAWDRIRRGERPDAAPQDAAEQRSSGDGARSAWGKRRKQATTAGAKEDSFSFEPSDAERAEAKAEAQREFDARLEKERRGEGGDGVGRRWG